MPVHPNSYESRKALIVSGKKKNRNQVIWECLYFHGPLTAREILNKIRFGSDDMNYVRPRLTDMLRDETSIKVVGEKIEGGLPVNVYDVNTPIPVKKQTSLF